MNQTSARRSWSMGAILARRMRRINHPHLVEDDRGDTLIEVLIALVVLGIASLAILVALLSSISSSAEYRVLATVDTMLRSAVGTITSQVEDASAASWENCTSTSGISLTSTSGYTYSVSSPEYWNGSAYTTTCTANASILLTVSVTHNGQTWSLATVLYDPQNRPQVTAGSASKLVFLTQPSNSEAGVAISPSPVVAVEDQNGNVVTSDLSAVTLAITSGSGTGGATLSSNCIGSEYYGVVTFNDCSISTAGNNYTLTATDGTLTPTTSSTFNVSVSVLTPTQLTITSSQITGAASSSATLGPITVEELNSEGNPVAAPTGGTVVALSSTDPSTGKFAASSGGTAVSSVTIPGGSTSVTFYYGDTLAGSPTLNLSSTGLSGTNQVITITPGTASALAFSPAAPGPGTAGSDIPNVSVEVTDAYGNVESTLSTGTVTMSIKAGSASTSFTSGTLTQSVSDGVAAFPDLVVTTAGTYTFTATPGSISGVTASVNSSSFTVKASTGVALKISSPPASSILAGTTLAMTVEEVDSYGNVVTTSSDSLSLTLSSGSFAGGTTTVNLVNGVASFTGLLLTLPNVYTITVSDKSNPSISSVSTGSITVGAGLPTQLVISTSAFHVTASNSPTQAVTVTLEDLFGNVTTSSTATTVTLGSSSSGKLFSLTSGGTSATTATIPAGQSSVTVYYADTKAGSPVLTFSASGLSSATQTESVAAGAASQVQITSTAFSVHASSAATQAFTVTLQDTYGNATTASTSTIVSLLSTSGAGIFATSSGGASTGSVTIPANTSSVTVYYGDTKAGSPIISVSATGLSGNSQTETITPAAGYQLVITSAPFTLTAINSPTQAFTIQLEDQYGNATTSTSSTTINLVSTSAGALFATTSGGTNVAHVTLAANTSSITVYYGDTAAGTPMLTASATGLQSGSQTETVSPAAAKKLVITSTALHMTATNAATQAFTLTMEDTYGNPTTSTSATQLTLGSTSSGAVFATSPSGTPTSSASIAAGLSSITLYYGDTKAGTPTITISSSPLTSATQVETVVAGTAAQLAVTTNPFSTTASTSATQSFTVTLEDAFGNPTTESSALTLSLGSTSSGAKFALTSGGGPVTTATLAANTSTITLYYADTVAGTPTLTIAATGVSSGTQTETVKPAAPYKLVYSTTPFSITATSVPSQPITVVMEDQYGNAATSTSSTTLTLNSTSPADRWSTSSGGTLVTTATLAAGQSSITLYYGDTAAGSWTVTVAATGLQTATQTDVVTPGPAYDAVISSSAFTTAASTSATQPFTVTLVDQYGNAVPAPMDTPVTLATSSGAGFFATTSGGAPTGTVTITEGSTSATAYYADTAAGHPTITPTALGVSAPAQTETITGGTPYQLVITTNPFTIGASGSPTQSLTVTLEDRWGNVTTSATATTLTLSSTSSGALWSTASGGTHVTTATLAANTSAMALYYGDSKVGSPMVTIAASGLVSATQTETVTAGSPYELVVTSSAFSITATNAPTQALTVTLEDRYGNVTTSSTATTLGLSSSSSGAVWSTASNGTHVTSATLPANTSSMTLYYGDTKAGSPLVTIAASGLVSATQTETVTAASPYQLAITSAAFSAAATSAPTHALTLTLEDQWGNPTTSASATTLTLGSTSGTAVWATSNNGAHVTTATLAANTSSISLYYGDTTPGSPTLTISASGLNSATQTETITGGAPYQLVVTSNPLSFTATNAPTHALTVTLEDQWGNTTTSTTATTLTLSSSSSGAVWSTSSNGTHVTTATLAANTSSMTLYYGDTKAGGPLVTIGANGIVAGTQTETVTAGAAYELGITSSAFSITATTAPTQALTVTLEDRYGNATTSTSATSLSLSSTSGTAVWSTTSNGTHVTTATLPANTSSMTLYYADTTAGHPTLTIAATGLTSATQTETITADVAYALEIVGLPSSVAGSTSATTPFTLEVVDQYGNATTSTSAISITLAANPAFRTYFATSSGGTAITATSIPANTSSIGLYFGSDHTSGTVAITISATGLVSATQTVTMT